MSTFGLALLALGLYPSHRQLIQLVWCLLRLASECFVWTFTKLGGIIAAKIFEEADKEAARLSLHTKDPQCIVLSRKTIPTYGIPPVRAAQRRTHIKTSASNVDCWPTDKMCDLPWFMQGLEGAGVFDDSVRVVEDDPIRQQRVPGGWVRSRRSRKASFGGMFNPFGSFHYARPRSSVFRQPRRSSNISRRRSSTRRWHSSRIPTTARRKIESLRRRPPTAPRRRRSSSFGGLFRRGSGLAPFQRARSPSVRERPRRGSTPGQRPSPGCNVPGYKLVKKLKTGGMSDAVNLVKNKRSGTLFIEKRVRADGFYRARTAQELKSLQLVQGAGRTHNINQLKEHQWSPSACTFILEYCDDGCLEDRILKYKSKGDRISEDFAWHVLKGIASALSFMHSIPLVHLDLKPCNVFLAKAASRGGGYPRIVVGDMGCSEEIGDRGREAVQQAGTPAWYPPEGQGRSGRYGKETDIWQMGATLQALCRLVTRPDRSTIEASPCGSRYSAELNAAVRYTTRFDWRSRRTAAEMVRHLSSRR